MTDAERTLDDDAIQRLAEVELASAQSAKQTILEEHSASFRWLMASLLALNGGGILAIADQEGLLPDWKIASLGSFYVGIISALAIAWLGQKSARAMLEPLAKSIGFWALVASTKEFDGAAHASLIGELQKSIRKTYLPRFAGWISVLGFSLGLAFLAIGSPRSDPDRTPEPTFTSPANITDRAASK